MPITNYSNFGLAGCVERRKNRDTGNTVAVYRADQAGLCDASGPWVTSCESHSTMLNHKTLAAARSHAGDPQSWCEACLVEDHTQGVKAFASVPLALVGHGFQPLPPGHARRWKTFGTWEKDGIRIALSSNMLITDDRGDVIIYPGDDEAWTIEALLVDPACRGQGHARSALKLLADCADHLQLDLYLEPVPLGPDVTNEGLVRLYASAGFKSDARGKVMARRAARIQ